MSVLSNLSGPSTATRERGPAARPRRRHLSFESSSRLPYLPALDGFRAVAVIAVMLYHADEAWLPGGYLGVEVFFTISGYLITALLLTEYEDSGTIDLRRFWIRRARRLLPALGLVLTGAFLLAGLTAPDALAELGGQVVAALAYVMNWSLIFTEQSYFESFGRPPLLQHLWSLAIEEQFYLLFPLLFVAGRRALGRTGTLVAVVVGAVASTAFMWSAFDPTVDPSRLYYGTDSRAAGILVGVALAMLWRPWASASASSVRTAALPDVLGIGGVVLLGVQLVQLGAYDARLYQGGFLTVSLATAAILAALATPGSFLAMGLSHRWLRWIGARSYGMYLWHWPLFMVLRPGVDTLVGDPWLTIVRLGATVVLAELSYTYVEQPIRRGEFLRRFRHLRRAAPEHAALRRGGIVVAACVVAMVAVGNAQLPVDRAVAATPTASPVASDPAPAPIMLVPGGGTAQPEDGEGADAGESDATGADAAADGLQTVPQDAVAGYDTVYVYGDSVIVGAAERFEALGDNVVVDARIGRQWHELVDDDRAPGPDDAVVIHLGSNGATNTATIDEVLGHFEDAGRVVLVNVRVPRPWETTVNRSLAAATGRWPNTVLADWNGASDASPSWFSGDGVHVSDAGARALASVVLFALDVPDDRTG